MDPTPPTAAIGLMEQFAEATGLAGSRPARRYLWTDAHAVCNFLELHRQTGTPGWLQLAERLIEQVHGTLGRHRGDDGRHGWISGMSEADGRLHPTAGGLRIGKPLPERRPDELPDPQQEWDQDGQYYHYLTRWMHALNRAAAATGADRYRRWAIELAVAAHRGFTAKTGPPRLHWKMRIDLSRPLLASSGHHDPLDGLVTSLVLSASATAEERQALAPQLGDLAALCRDRDWATDDPLGLGGLLFDAGRLAQLPEASHAATGPLLARVLDAAEVSLLRVGRSGFLGLAAGQRLAFRELGLAIGLHAVPLLYRSRLPAAMRLQLDRLRRHAPLVETIERFWLDPEHRHAATWQAHEDINTVMLATSLVPLGLLLV
ncbi:MAG: hypothetical protein RIC56_13660 [Pseudomonadales bacterium]